MGCGQGQGRKNIESDLVSDRQNIRFPNVSRLRRFIGLPSTARRRRLNIARSTCRAATNAINFSPLKQSTSDSSCFKCRNRRTGLRRRKWSLLETVRVQINEYYINNAIEKCHYAVTTYIGFKCSYINSLFFFIVKKTSSCKFFSSLYILRDTDCSVLITYLPTRIADWFVSNYRFVPIVFLRFWDPFLSIIFFFDFLPEILCILPDCNGDRSLRNILHLKYS